MLIWSVHALVKAVKTVVTVQASFMHKSMFGLPVRVRRLIRAQPKSTDEAWNNQ